MLKCKQSLKNYILSRQKNTFAETIMNGLTIGTGVTINVSSIFSNKDETKCKELLEQLEKCKENYSCTHVTEEFCKDIIENYNKHCL